MQDLTDYLISRGKGFQTERPAKEKERCPNIWVVTCGKCGVLESEYEWRCFAGEYNNNICTRESETSMTASVLKQDPNTQKVRNNAIYWDVDDEAMLNVFRCQLTYQGQVVTNAEARFNNSLRPRKPEGSLGRTAQDGHLDFHTAPELCFIGAKHNMHQDKTQHALGQNTTCIRTKHNMHQDNMKILGVIPLLCLIVLINSVILNLLCLWI